MGIVFSPLRALLGIFASVLALATSSCSAPSLSAPDTKLDITIWIDGKNTSATYTLECIGDQATDKSTLPEASAACAQLEQTPQVVTGAIDPRAACTEIYGGPQRAEVAGKLHGVAVHTEFSRTNGCLINQWDAAEFLFQAGL